MKLYQDRIDILDYKPSTAKTAGDVVSLGGGLVGIVHTDTPANSQGSVYIQGLFRNKKASGVTFNQGDTVYWDATNKVLTNVSQDITLGYAVNLVCNPPGDATDQAFALVPFYNPMNAGDGIIVSEKNAISVGATAISLDNTTLSLTEAAGASHTGSLTATCTPQNLPATVVWTTSKASVATVSGGTVTGVAAGTATITATVNGVASATCAVTVA